MQQRPAGPRAAAKSAARLGVDSERLGVDSERLGVDSGSTRRAGLRDARMYLLLDPDDGDYLSAGFLHVVRVKQVKGCQQD